MEKKLKAPVYLFLFSFCLLLTDIASAEISSMSSAINKAGRQRMLTQRIVATYCQVGLGIKTQKSREQLKESIALFDEQLSELKIFRPEGKVNQQLMRVEKLWKPFKKIASLPVNRDQAEELRLLAEDTLRASQRVVIMLEDEAQTHFHQLVNISGRQRMLSQRMSNLYMLQAWNFTSNEYTDDYSIAINEFKGALLELMNSKYNTQDISHQLKKVKREFSMLERSLKQKEGVFIPLLVKLSADKLLINMDEITHKYEYVAGNL